jgi:cytochrome P450
MVTEPAQEGARCPYPGATLLRHPLRRASAVEQPALHAELRERQPVTPIEMADGVMAFLVTRYEDATIVLDSPQFSRKALSATDPAEMIALQPRPPSEDEGAAHTVPHELVSRALSAKSVQTLRPRIEQLADELLTAIGQAQPPVDLMTHLARPLPTTIICELLGMPATDQAWLAERAPSQLMWKPDSAAEQARVEMADHFTDLLAAKRTAGGEDILSMMVRAQAQDPSISTHKLVVLAMRLAVGGFHTLATSLGRGLPIILRDRAHYRALAENPGLVDSAVEEILRLASPTDTALPRLALADVELSGVLVPKGSVVLVALDAANHDRRFWGDAGKVDFGRDHVRRHLAFGWGSNYCVGSALARLELQVLFEQLPKRFPTLRLAVEERDIPWREGIIGNDPLELMVTW